MGAGKTTLGQLVAMQAGLPFYDSDDEIEVRCGADISWIFDKEGEAGFRDRESVMLEELLHKPRYLIATGGGAILRKNNRELIQQNAFVIYLCVSVDRQLQYLSMDTKRPLLQNVDRFKVLTELKEKRDPLYRSVSDVVFDIKGDDTKAIVAELSNLIQSSVNL
ncbi:MAG: shikimate kinase [Pseudomonadota bacterium]